MNIRFRFISVIVCLLWMGLGTAVAQYRYRTQLLSDMAKSLSVVKELKSVKDGSYLGSFSYKKRPLSVRVSQGEISHLGYFMFTGQQRSGANEALCNCLERYVLQLTLQCKNEEEIGKHLVEDDLNFAKGNFSTLLKLVGDTTKIFKTEILNEKRYRVSWYVKDELHCSVDFPVDYHFLYGEDMAESELKLTENLVSYKAPNTQPLLVTREDLLATFQPNYFIYAGDFYYTDQLNTNRYYEKSASGAFQLICNRRYPLESLANLFTTCEVKNDFTVRVRLIRYNYQEDNFSVSLQSFISFLQHQGCTVYFGVINYENTKAVCQLVARNEKEGYCHTMRATVDVEQLIHKKGEISLRMNAYIPVSKIKNLFQE